MLKKEAVRIVLVIISALIVISVINSGFTGFATKKLNNVCKTVESSDGKALCGEGYSVMSGGWVGSAGRFAKPQGNGFYCEDSSSSSKCYAICCDTNHVESVIVTKKSRLDYGIKTYCPSGYEVVGGGFEDKISNTDQDSLSPLNNNGWYCQDDDSSDEGSSCYAVCAKSKDTDYELNCKTEVKEASIVSELYPQDITKVSVECPDNYFLTGGGFKDKSKSNDDQDYSYPVGNSWFVQEDFNEDEAVDGIGYAICCRLEKVRISKCEDGVDNDNDGYIDYPEDKGCSDINDGERSRCQDGKDNDNDGFIDLLDPDCENVQDDNEKKGMDVDKGGTDIDCPAIYEPVCGVDRNTYSNNCYLVKNGVNKLYDGECILGVCGDGICDNLEGCSQDCNEALISVSTKKSEYSVNELIELTGVTNSNLITGNVVDVQSDNILGEEYSGFPFVEEIPGKMWERPLLIGGSQFMEKTTIELIVKYKSKNTDEINSLGLNIIDIKKIEQILPDSPSAIDDMGLSNVYLLTIESRHDPEIIAAKIAELPNVEFAEPNRIYEIYQEPDYHKQWMHQNLKSELAWQIEQGNKDVVIAIIDTGVDWDHPDLAANIWENEDEIPDDGIDNDNNRYVDDVRGYDFVNLFGMDRDYCEKNEDCVDNDNDPMDFNGHGTHCSGIAVAAKNNVGIVGMCPGCSVMPIRAGFAIRGGGAGLTTTSIAQSLNYAINNGADIISMSYGSRYKSSYIKKILDRAVSEGIILVAAAGNDGWDWPHYPSGYANVISVGATTNKNEPADFSNYGSDVEISAPGNNIYSTVVDGYASYSGTSMSTPLVAGVIGLMKSHYPELTTDEVRTILSSTSSSIKENNYKWFGSGIVNPSEALLQSGIVSGKVNMPKPFDHIGGVYKFIFRSYLDSEYELYIGEGYYPESSNYYLMHSGSINGKITVSIDLDDFLAEKKLTGKLFNLKFVLKKNGIETAYKVPINVKRRTVITSPKNGDVITGTKKIKGRVMGDFENYVIKWKNKNSPTEPWSKEGIILVDDGKLPVDGILGELDTKKITEDYLSDILLRVIVDRDGWKDKDTNRVAVDNTFHQGWPKTYPSKFRLRNGATSDSMPLVVDLDNDLNKEIVFEILQPDEILVYAYKHNGETLSGYPISIIPEDANNHYTFADSHNSPSAADLNNDGNKEIIITTISDYSWDMGEIELVLHAFDLKGNYLLGWPKKFNVNGINGVSNLNPKNPLAVDLDNDGNVELVIKIGGTVFVFSNNGDLILNLDYTPDGSKYILASTSDHQTISFGDINNDGNKEMIFATNYWWNDDVLIHVVDLNGNELPGYPYKLPRGGTPHTKPAIADIDNDGILEFAFVEIYRDANRQLKLRFYLMDKNGVIDGWPKDLPDGYNQFAGLVFADLNNDNIPEVLYSHWVGYLRVVDIFGNKVSGWPDRNLFFRYLTQLSTFSVADIDGDGFQEVINGLTTLYKMNEDPIMMKSMSISNSRMVSRTGVTLSDIDNDRKLEMVIVLSEKHGPYKTTVYVWDLEDQYGDLHWPMPYHDSQRSSTYGQLKDSVNSIIENTGAIDLKGYVRLSIEFYSNGQWIDQEIVVDDYSSKDLRVVRSGKRINLNVLWDSVGGYKADFPGNYRVVAEFLNQDGKIMNTKNKFMQTFFEFTIKS